MQTTAWHLIGEQYFKQKEMQHFLNALFFHSIL